MTLDDDRPPLAQTRFKLRNVRKSVIVLKLEPWGETHSVAPGAEIELIARGPSGDALEVQWGRSEVTVYGWPGSVVRLVRRGEMLDLHRLPAPYVPPGMRTREWLEAYAALA